MCKCTSCKSVEDFPDYRLLNVTSHVVLNHVVWRHVSRLIWRDVTCHVSRLIWRDVTCHVSRLIWRDVTCHVSYGVTPRGAWCDVTCNARAVTRNLQVWIFTPDCRILQGDFCLELSGSRRGEPVLGLCKKKSQYQTWKYDTNVSTN